MKNPLHKRISRELRSDFSKYIVLFLFMSFSIGFVSGDFIAADSMSEALTSSYEDDIVEDGHFRLQREASDSLIDEIEKEDVTIYADYYTEATYTGTDGVEKTLRIYRGRKDINRPCLMEGALPKEDNDLAIDRMYADNNDLSVGDTLTLEGETYNICGLVALSDYGCLFESTTDTMFDALNFSVALVTTSRFVTYSASSIRYNYAWRYNDGSPDSEEDEKNMSDDLSEAIVKAILDEDGGSEIALALGILSLGNDIEEYVPRYANQAIVFARDDIGGDRNLMLALLCILIVILAFLFGVTISHTIARESTVIGTLRASGYTKRELFCQYITMPIIITVFSAIVGNILGYTVFKDVMASLYYNSYSLPTFHTIWNMQAFIQTTLLPVLLMFVVTGITLVRKLKYAPLAFLRSDFDKGKEKKARALPNIGFFDRFRIRILLQNKSSYITMFFGILTAMILLIFGMLFPPLLENVADLAVDSMICDYQYILEDEEETADTEAEPFAVKTMLTYAEGHASEDASVYGIETDSRYITEDMPDKGVLISNGYADKYQLQIGDTFLLKEDFENTLVELRVAGIFNAPTLVNVYMSKDMYCELFDLDDDYYNGYFSDRELTDLSEDNVATCITEKDMTKFSEQMTHSMGDVMNMVLVFAVILFVLVIYILTKMILERNSSSISMVRILGYTDGEIAKLYLVATSWAVVISILVSLCIVSVLMKYIFILVMKDYSGWVPYGIGLSTYIQSFIICILAYICTALLQMRKIKKISIKAISPF